MYDVEKAAAEIAVGYTWRPDEVHDLTQLIAAALRDALEAGYREGWAAGVEAAERAAVRFADEAAERGPMIGGLPMHEQEVHDRALGELVARNIAAAVRALKGEGGPC
jgi:hypothetical protein